ncbi:sugar diacid recognition domain-containing protein [Bacillus sp. 31A1R]|uniref:Sugar diacid recognition domain-containing protein n=1 Tax=Robertmurraya mangrovi TaxID=3098077 RepID=A0ABU5ITN7_9BACI|nr:sugar diacid recognition domain-containing protein [Bacillus sp. 31A1R]MDZ5470514.1 sugar diacid recognition domain-containing protein [Bacillus sp. 31A1R]
MLIRELAEKIVNEVRKLLGEDIIVVDTNGIIIASTDPHRINTFHEGALKSIVQKDKLIITEEDEHILKGVKAGINLPVFFNKEVIGVIGITGNPEKVSPYGEVIRKMTELLVSESYFTEQFDWQSRAYEALLFEWIQIKEWNPTFIHKATLLNVDLNVNRRVAIAEFTQDSFLPHRDIWLSVFSWNEKSKEDLIVRLGNNRIIYLLSDQESLRFTKEKLSRFQKMLNEHLQVNVNIGVGSVTPPTHLNQTYQQAERALNSSKIENEIVYDEELTLEMIIEEIKMETKLDFIERTIGTFVEDHELIETLKTFFEEDLSLKNTAESLHIHINTLHYRLKKIMDLSNLNPRKTEDLFKLYLSTLFLDKHLKN